MTRTDFMNATDAAVKIKRDTNTEWMAVKEFFEMIGFTFNMRGGYYGINDGVATVTNENDGTKRRFKDERKLVSYISEIFNDAKEIFGFEGKYYPL